MPVHDDHQISKAFLQRHGRDRRRPGLIGPVDDRALERRGRHLVLLGLPLVLGLGAVLIMPGRFIIDAAWFRSTAIALTPEPGGMTAGALVRRLQRLRVHPP